MKVLVTGANGLLGSNLLRILIHKGHDVKALILPGENTDTIDSLSIEKVEGNVLNFDELLVATYGVDAICHLAASTACWPRRNRNTRKVNIEGTRNVIRAAMRSGVKRMIYVGTANSFSYGCLKSPGREGTPYKAHKYRLDYMDSKYQAQQLVLKAVSQGLPAIIVNPTFMLGPYDSKPSSGQLLLAVHSRKVFGYAPGGRNYICVKDAAMGIANALTMGRVGESYILGNENLSYKQAFSKMANIIEVKPPVIKFPKWAVMMLGATNSLIGFLTRKNPGVTFPLARIACDEHYYSAEKAVRELKLPQSPIEEGIHESYEWLKANNYLKNAQ